MKHHRTIFAALALALALAIALPASAQFRKPEEAIKYRKSVMYTMGNHFYGRLGPMANARIPFDAKTAVEDADLVAVLAKLPWIAFAPGTEKGETDVKPAIWTEQAKFKDLTERMLVETTKLTTAARTGDLDALRVAYRSTANSCKACHDAFTNQ